VLRYVTTGSTWSLGVGNIAANGTVALANKFYIQNGLSPWPRLVVDTNGNVGIGTASPSYNLSLGGDAARTIGMERTTTGTNGYNLNVIAGHALAGGTDLNGGNLYLSSGTATGTGASNIYFNTSTAQASTNTTDNTTTTKMAILGNGNVGIGTTSPAAALDVESGQILTQAGSATSPAIAVGSSGTGIYKTATGVGVAVSGGLRWTLSDALFASFAAGPQLQNNSANSTTAPVIEPNRADPTTGFAAGVQGNINAIVGGVEVTRWTSTGFGIGTATPAAKLDVNGFMRLAKNSSAPATCSATIDGAIALTSARRMCVCDGTNWTEVNSATACTW
jgi:hypothetical protein